jgi:hypothetical protein
MFFPNKYLLIHIPKTGGSSLEHAIVSSFLADADNNQLDDIAYKRFTVHGHFENKIQGHGGHTHSFIAEYDQFLNIDDYCKFVVLRNPFDQVISLYNQLRKQVPIPSLEHFILGEENLTIKNVSHYIDQYKFTHINGELCADKVFVFDRYQEAQDFVEDKFQLKMDRSKRLWKTEYTGEQLSTKAKDYFESIYHQSIELYHRYL